VGKLNQQSTSIHGFLVHSQVWQIELPPLSMVSGIFSFTTELSDFISF